MAVYRQSLQVDIMKIPTILTILIFTFQFIPSQRLTGQQRSASLNGTVSFLLKLICYLFNNAVESSNCKALKLMDSKLEGIWKKVVLI